MAQWWESLSTLQHIFLYTAMPFTVVLLIQTVITLIGLGGGGADADAVIDADADIDADVDPGDGTAADGGAESGDFSHVGFRFFTIQGIIVFFCIFGWTGYALGSSDLGTAPVLLISAAAGFLAMLVIGLMFYAVKRLQSSGNIRYSNAVGKTAEVYIPIPPMRSGRGKIMVEIQERLIEAEAVTDENEKLKTGETVRVTGNSGSTLIVKR